ncbi:coronin-2B-like isoform X2 [Centruroides sculpturatus]|uniref:coronin-2B-like isoform X2 n=1 Tax=Centruroides sculpturatus TaxID=218467 RepID=UPI000C6E7988|nr:coronin-2B-like isoform X2 [Centruroides sculpturatus]
MSPTVADGGANQRPPPKHCVPDSAVTEKCSYSQISFRGVRTSKFRHIYGSPARKDNCYECIKITKNAHDSYFCAANPKFVAVVTETAGGGAFLVIPIEKVGLKTSTFFMML